MSSASRDERAWSHTQRSFGLSDQHLGPDTLPAPPRLMAIWVPDWPVVSASLEARHTRRADPALAPVAVVAQRKVIATSPPARMRGIRSGMSARQARSLCPELVIIGKDSQRESRHFEPVMEAICQVAATTVVMRPGLALATAGGPARWMGSESSAAEMIVEEVAHDPGVECQVGIADSLLAAVLAAQQGIIVPAGASADFLSPWPLFSLTTALTSAQAHGAKAMEDIHHVLKILQRLGIRTLGDFAALSAQDVSTRFGALGCYMHDLARGRSWSVPSTDRPQRDIDAQVDFDPPLSHSDSVAFIAHSASQSLLSRLARAGLGAGSIRIEAICEDGTTLSRSWLLDFSPQARELTDRIRWQIDGWLNRRPAQQPHSPLVTLRLVAEDLSPTGIFQTGLWAGSDQEARQRASRAAGRIESLLGIGSVRMPRVVPGRDPRSRVRYLPWGHDEGELNLADSSAVHRSHHCDDQYRPAGALHDEPPRWVGMLPPPWPSIVLSAPEPLLLCDESGEEVGVNKNGELGSRPSYIELSTYLAHIAEYPAPGRYSIREWGGPWPIDEGWWLPQGASRRAYLQIITNEGAPLLLARSHCWWVDAVYH